MTAHKRNLVFTGKTGENKVKFVVRAQGLEPWTYGLKVPPENSEKTAFETEKTVAKNQVPTCSKNCAQQKAQHFSDQVLSDQAENEVSRGIDQANGSIEASSENDQRKGHSNATGTQSSFEFVSSQWQHLQPGIREAILLLDDVELVELIRRWRILSSQVREAIIVLIESQGTS